MIFETFDQIPLWRYGLIMADPPWRYLNWSKKGHRKGAAHQYECMTLDEIKKIPVQHYCDQDCWLWLWATNPMLPQCLATMEAWGFDFCTAGHWSKKTVKGNQSFGTGYVLRGCGEPFLIGKLGNPPTFAKNVRGVIEDVTREHSRKPEKAYAEAERLFGDVPRLDMFSRQARPGWDSFGNEVRKFEGKSD